MTLNPFLLMAALFVALAALAAVETALISLGLAPAFSGIRWLRVHLLTLGILAETVFGLTPLLVSRRAGCRAPAIRWDIWLTLNAGLLTLLVAIPPINGPLIVGGGALIFAAAVLLINQLRALAPPSDGTDPAGRPFYLLGLGFLLVGIVIGSGLWNGWAEPLRIAVPLEAHIHANVFGFLGLTVAGLLLDLVPTFTGRQPLRPRPTAKLAAIMGSGGLLLVLAPWTGLMPLNVVGILLYLTSTVWLLVTVARPLLGDRHAWTPGVLHLTTGYFWFLAPLFVAPMVLSGIAGETAATIEQTAPQALIFGWAAQVGYALVPGLLGWLLHPGGQPRLGGSWVSLGAAHLGGVAIWASILIAPLQATLYALAYGFWSVALLVTLRQAWSTVTLDERQAQDEDETAVPVRTAV
ncbi:MAG: NnrS family protein [Chloroflexi bacterium]|nr:NnrS family protein [Chloroflexota bacterium]